MDIYDQLLQDMGSLKNADEEVSGMDAYLSGEQVKVASMDMFYNFLRLSDNTLVHKAEKDLWKISESSTGDVVIQRLFDPETKEPLKI